MLKKPSLYDLNAQQVAQGEANLKLAKANLGMNALQLMEMADMSAEISGRLDAVNANLRQLSRKIDSQTRILGNAIDRNTAAVIHGTNLATSQRYAQWRDSTENGGFYHYTYVPQAQEYLRNVGERTQLWTIMVHQKINEAIKRLEPEKQKAVRTGIYTPLPQFEPDAITPIEADPRLQGKIPTVNSISGELSNRKKIFLGCLLLSIFLFLFALYVSNQESYGIIGIIAAAILSIFTFGFVYLEVALIDKVGNIKKAKKQLPIRLEELKKNHQAQIDAKNASILQAWEQKNNAAANVVIRELSEMLGFNPTDKRVFNSWSDFAHLQHAYRIKEFLIRSQEHFPARNELIDIPVINYTTRWHSTALDEPMQILSQS